MIVTNKDTAKETRFLEWAQRAVTKGTKEKGNVQVLLKGIFPFYLKEFRNEEQIP